MDSIPLFIGLSIAADLLIIAIVIFHPELRRFFEKIRRGDKNISQFLSQSAEQSPIIKNILTAVEAMSQQKLGGLIVIELKENLDKFIESGIPIRAKLTSELLLTLFWHNSPTHDGAIVIREGQIAAAGCLLPLTESKVQDKRLGTRHRAAIGVSELSDALVIVVSEETGAISIVEGGNMTRYLNREALETRLFNLYSEAPKKSPGKTEKKERFSLFKKETKR